MLFPSIFMGAFMVFLMPDFKPITIKTNCNPVSHQVWGDTVTAGIDSHAKIYMN
jgi:hypothetical protein